MYREGGRRGDGAPWAEEQDGDRSHRDTKLLGAVVSGYDPGLVLPHLDTVQVQEGDAVTGSWEFNEVWFAKLQGVVGPGHESGRAEIIPHP
jgi:hypothetical protein